MCAALFGLIAVCSTMVLPVLSVAVSRRRRRDVVPQACDQKRRPVEKHVQVAVRRGVDARHAGNRRDDRRQLLGDRARRLLEDARQLEGDRDGQIAERAVGRHLHGKRRDGVDTELPPNRLGDRVVKLSLQAEHHVNGSRSD